MLKKNILKKQKPKTDMLRRNPTGVHGVSSKGGEEVNGEKDLWKSTF